MGVVKIQGCLVHIILCIVHCFLFISGVGLRRDAKTLGFFNCFFSREDAKALGFLKKLSLGLCGLACRNVLCCKLFVFGDAKLASPI